MTEAQLKSKIKIFLKEGGCYVIITRPGYGTPTGCPDIIFMYEGIWGAIEVKRSATAPYRPGQEATLNHFRKTNPFVYTAYPENWENIKAQLLEWFF